MTPTDEFAAALADRYVIRRELGRGGMATVYLADDLKHGRQVAVKVFHPDMAATIGTERFLREIEVGARLQHPHILMLIDSGQAAGLLYYVMPYVAGESLRAKLDREPQLSIEEALRFTREIAGALEYAHREGVVHRDIKPDNIMLSDGHAILMDFGIARAINVAGTDPLTQLGQAIGTPAYMSPEQSGGEENVDGRTDVYALATVLYEMLAGETPFTGATAQGVLARQMVEPVRSLRTVRPAVSRELDGVIVKALAKVPGDRFDGPGAFADALEKARLGGRVPGRGTRSTRSRNVLAAVIVLLLVAGFWIIRGLGTRGEPVAVSPTDIAVLPFSVRGGAEIQYLGEGVANLLSTNLDGVGTLRSVDSRALLALMEQEPARPVLDPVAGQAVARQFGAGLYILGDILQVGSRLRIDATLYDLAGAAQGEATAEGEQGDVFALVDALTAQLLLAHTGSDDASDIRIASITTGSLPALKAYLEGEEAYRRGRYLDALEAFQRAVAEDSLFALAHYRLSLAGEWSLRSEIADAAAEDAVRHAGRLSARDRRILDAYLVRRSGDNAEAERLYRSILGTYPDDMQAWLDLGEILFHANPLHGKPFTESREAFDRVLFFDPDHSTTLIHASRIAARDGRLTELDSLAKTFVALASGGERALEIEALQVFTDGTADDQALVLDQLALASDLTNALAVWDVAVFARNLDGAERAARLLTRPTRSPEARRLGHAWLAHFALARGQWQNALVELARIDEPGVRLEYQALLSTLDFVPRQDQDLVALRDALLAFDPSTSPASGNPSVVFNVHDPLHAPIRLYFLGLVHAQLGDTSRALRYATELEGLGEVAASTLTADLAASVRAEVNRLQGRPREALADLAGARRGTWYGQTLASPYYAQARERFTQAELLFGLGRMEDALQWYETLLDLSAFEVVYAPMTELRQGQIHQALGNTAKARAHYQAFLELWREADPEFLPYLEEANRRLAALEPERD